MGTIDPSSLQVTLQNNSILHCDVCATRFSGCVAGVAIGSYFDLLTRDGLTIPSLELSQYVSQCFAVLNYTDKRVRVRVQYVYFSNVQTSLVVPPDSLFYVTTAQMFYIHVSIILLGVVKQHKKS